MLQRHCAGQLGTSALRAPPPWIDPPPAASSTTTTTTPLTHPPLHTPTHPTHLVVDVCVRLPPAEVVPQGGGAGVAHSPGVKHGSVLQWRVRQVLGPHAHVVAGEAAGHEAHDLGAAPACRQSVGPRGLSGASPMDCGTCMLIKPAAGSGVCVDSCARHGSPGHLEHVPFCCPSAGIGCSCVRSTALG